VTDRPFLLRLMREQRPQQGPPFRYDHELDELLILDGGHWVSAVDSPAGSLMTKKKDIEKGEDAKDRW
jgi:hypothetical protein